MTDMLDAHTDGDGNPKPPAIVVETVSDSEFEAVLRRQMKKWAGVLALLADR